ncbi:MAG: IS200/IS605 family transposase [Acidobacteriota bacterium]|nr:IS200/IS605 family transposase [Acidobacteriota bacterium]
MANTFTSLHFHLVFSTKNRAPFLSEEQGGRMHEYLGGCLRELGATPLEIGGVADHVHLLTGLKPTHRLSDVLRATKKGSSEWIRGKLENFHWQDGYSAFTVSPSQLERVRTYIQRQAEHHRKRTFVEEYRDLLRAHAIDFDERFLL